MKPVLPLLLLLAACRTAHPPPRPYVSAMPSMADVFDGHPPVVVMDLDAAPDSIATVVAERYCLPKKQARKFLRHARRR